ncbi:MAG: SUMF1/EgtB/PvdO family nonheme iron enzyme [Deltaproteobacteria bacterium]|nr:SUMF1/EgtB/PvdO family nonheme iron enzyme [Deltaproteobacteria bacterium]
MDATGVDAPGADASVGDAPIEDATPPDGPDDAGLSDALVWDASVGPSCAQLPPTCGPFGTADCCASAPVPGGTFYRGYDAVPAGGHEDRSFPATVNAFRLDVYEITVARFRKFVQAGGGTRKHPPAGVEPWWDASWNIALEADRDALSTALTFDPQYGTWTAMPGSNEDRPIACLTWYEAQAFCLWDGGRLPTAAEWNFAAAGGAEQRAYPWSSPPTSTVIDPIHASYGDGAGQCFGTGGTLHACSVQDLLPPGSKPPGDGRWGHADLSGNVSEWVFDFAGTFVNPCTDCTGPTSSLYRLLGGGSFLEPPDQLWSSLGRSFPPGSRGCSIGARCVRRP